MKSHHLRRVLAPSQVVVWDEIEKINGDSTNVPFHNFSLMARRKTHSGLLHLGPVAGLEKRKSCQRLRNATFLKIQPAMWETSFYNTPQLPKHLGKMFHRFRFHRFHHLPTSNCPAKSPWRTRSSAVRSCGKLSRSTEEPLQVNNGKSCPGLMTKGPQGPQEVSRKSKDVKEEDMENGQNASKMRMERSLTWRKIHFKNFANPTNTCHKKLLPPTATCYQLATISILNPLFHSISTCLHHVKFPHVRSFSPGSLGQTGYCTRSGSGSCAEWSFSRSTVSNLSPLAVSERPPRCPTGVPTVPPFGEAPM